MKEEREDLSRFLLAVLIADEAKDAFISEPTGS
jgi:hypothetical protein